VVSCQILSCFLHLVVAISLPFMYLSRISQIAWLKTFGSKTDRSTIAADEEHDKSGILLWGRTGVGKSSFISLCGAKDPKGCEPDSGATTHSSKFVSMHA